MNNFEIAKMFREISMLLTMDDIPFKPAAYEEASITIGQLDRELKEIYMEGGTQALDDIPGVGSRLALQIEELLKTKKLKLYTELKKKYPIDVLELSRVEGVGPKTIKKLYEALKIKNIAQLERAARGHKLSVIPGFGRKKEEHILRSIDFVYKSSDRFVLGYVYPQVASITAYLQTVPGISDVRVAGSARRMQETVGDLDFVVVTDGKKDVSTSITSMPYVSDIIAKGENKVRVRLFNGLQVDVEMIQKQSLGAALTYFTGSREHTIALRTRAQRMGLTLNEYGLFRDEKMKKRIASETEEDIYQALKLQYIPPEMREMTGELELAEQGKIPDLINYGDIRGDLQVQTDWSDGVESIEEMAKKARAAGLSYFVVTDHTKSLSVANGLDEKRLLKQMKYIDELNKKFKGKPYILKGSEVEILKDGTLDIADEVLGKLDVVGIAVHSYFDMSKKDMTERICKAMRNPYAHILFHPTGRIIHKRPGYELDMDVVVRVAKETGTILEINASPDRLDLHDAHIRKAREAGVRFSIDTDAHASDHFTFLKFGIGQARRGWVQKKDIINTYPWKEMKSFLK